MRDDYPADLPWALATLATDDGPLACLETPAGLFDLKASALRAGARVTDVAGLFQDWPASVAILDRAARNADPADAVPDGPREAPIRFPGKVLCAGANYYRHLEEMGVEDRRREAQRLFFFFKPPRNAVVGEGDSVRMPLDSRAFDWEIEMAAVIGRRARAVSPETALDHVAGYMVGIDFSARDLNRAPETFYKLDWVAGKAQDSCCPLGPRLVPATAVPDPQAVGLRLSVNGAVKQDDSTADMIFTVAEQIAIASRIMTLDPGDVLLTGTPAGVGVPRGEFLAVGDRVVAEIAGVGRLAVTVQPPDAG